MARLTQSITRQDHKRGNIMASTTLVEYGDYECPYCAEAYPTLKKLLTSIGKEYCFVFRNFPLSDMHPYALHSAYAAEAAGKQEKFWDMHDTLFEHQDNLTDDDLFGYAKDLGLDIQQFQDDFQSETIAQKVQVDIQSGIESGVNGTPTFFINRTRYDGEYNYSSFQSLIEEHIPHRNYAR